MSRVCSVRVDSRREQPHQVLLYPSVAAPVQLGMLMGTIQGPSLQLGTGVGCGRNLSLSISFEEKMASEMLFSSVCFSQLQRAQRGKKGESAAMISAIFQTYSCFKCRFPNARLVFCIIQLHEEQRREAAIQFVRCQEKLSSWRARNIQVQKGEEGKFSLWDSSFLDIFLFPMFCFNTLCGS